MIEKLTLPAHLINYRIPWGPVGKPVYERSYSHDFEDGTKETWPHTVVRAVDGNLGLVDATHIESNEREKLIELLMPFGITPAGRHLFASGLKGRQFLFNCHASGWDPQEPSAHFSFLFDELMQGGGVGANYSNRYMYRMPSLVNNIDLHVVCREDHPNLKEFEDHLSEHNSYLGQEIFRVEDSREGWVSIVDHILRMAYADKESDARKEECITVDVSDIRERGKPLKTSGGTACGPGPLVTMLVNLVKVINGCVGRRMTSLDAMSIDHALADCVIAGGKRRSSRMSVKNWKDKDIFEFINCKKQDGDHWTTNISVEVDDEFITAYNEGFEHARMVMRQIILGKRANGEPGIWNISLAKKDERHPERVYCPNPCGEIALHMWENCNLGHINLGYFANKKPSEMSEAFRLMTRWLVRATFGDIPQKRQRAVVDENRRIGVGFLGFHEWLVMRGIKYSECYKNQEVITTLRSSAHTVKTEAAAYATELGIPVPIKTTTLAPTGTNALLSGTTQSGQCMLFPWFKRLVRYASNDPQLAIKKSEGYETFPDIDAQNTEIVVYWCEDPLVAKVRNAGFDPDGLLEGQFDISLRDSLEVQKMLQTHYADNAISYTINMLPERMPSEEEMEAQIFAALPFIKGTTVFPEKSRKNPPFQPITKEEFDAHQGQKEVTQTEAECKGACPIR